VDRNNYSISPQHLYARLVSEAAPIIVDVRRDADFYLAPRSKPAMRRAVRDLARSVANFPDDHAMLKHGMVIYDALYTWCRALQAETHNWSARVAGA
jgi:hypothetical protein